MMPSMCNLEEQRLANKPVSAQAQDTELAAAIECLEPCQTSTRALTEAEELDRLIQSEIKPNPGR